MTRQLFTFGVYGHRSDRTPERVATFFTYSDAADFVTENLTRNLYLTAPAYDRRASGYRPAEAPSGYREWLMELKQTGKNTYRVAA